MAKVSKTTFTLLLLIIGAAGLLFVKEFLQKSPQEQTAIPARAKGNPHAELQIVEFIDLQCPACASGSQTLHQYFQQFPQQMFIELKYFPLAMHRHGMLSAWYTECAARQGRFWPFAEKVIHQQKNWSGLTDAKPAFQEIAQEVGLDQPKLDACLQDPSVETLILKLKEEGQTRGVKSTPTYFINGEMVVGAKSLQAKLSGHFGVTLSPATESAQHTPYVPSGTNP
jgi:protein-disulfide isomerase